jgi:phosphatidyl-N-methylethanolamine N-methyltransferase
MGIICREPTIAVRRLFYLFKGIQISVLAGWCYYFSHGVFFEARQRLAPVALGLTILTIGQILNWAVFYRLGTVGVFYGNRFGHPIPRSRGFPFSLFNHPQYVGAVASVWGFFMITRFPSPDWYLLPAVETLYYGVGTWLEK